MRIRVGNLSSSSTETDLWRAFERCGQVDSVRIVTSRDTGMRLGFAFVEMEDETEAQMAIQSLHGSDLGGQSIQVIRAALSGPLPAARGH